MNKKALIIGIVLIVVLLLSSCSKSENNTDVASSTVNSTVTENNGIVSDNSTTKPTIASVPVQDDNDHEVVSNNETYTHTAIEGAVIAKQDGSSSYSFYEHCEKCGTTFSNVSKNHTASFGTYTTSFHCTKCGNQQSVRIETTSN